MAPKEPRMRLPKIGIAHLNLSDFNDADKFKIYGDYFDDGTDQIYSPGHVGSSIFYDWTGHELRYRDKNGSTQRVVHYPYGNIYAGDTGFHIDGHVLDDLPTIGQVGGDVDVAPPNSVGGYLYYSWEDPADGYDYIRKTTLAGDILWTGPRVSSTDGQIYVDSSENVFVSGAEFRRIDASNGSELWAKRPESRSRSVCSDGSYVYTITEDFVQENTLATKHNISDGSEVDRVILDSSESAAGNGCIVTSANNDLICDANAKVWRVDKSNMTISHSFGTIGVFDLNSSPPDSRVMNDGGGNDNFYVITDTGVRKYDGSNNQLWETATNGVRGQLYFCESSQLDDENAIVQTTPGDKKYVLDPSTGNILHTTSSSDTAVACQGGRLI